MTRILADDGWKKIVHDSLCIYKHTFTCSITYNIVIEMKTYQRTIIIIIIILLLIYHCFDA